MLWLYESKWQEEREVGIEAKLFVVTAVNFRTLMSIAPADHVVESLSQHQLSIDTGRYKIPCSPSTLSL